MLGIIIQARNNSSRLPNKINLSICDNLTILDIIIQKLKTLKNVKIILATSNNSKDNILKNYSLKYHIDFFQGSENDVLSRFILACEKHNVDKAIRVCADNPFIDVNLLKKLIDLSSEKQYDYASYYYKNIPTIRTHFGIFSEFVSLSALKKIRAATSENKYIEHVTNYIYENEQTFNILKIPFKHKGERIRLTIDDLEDFNLLKNIINQNKKLLFMNYNDVFRLVVSNNNNKKIMKKQILKYEK
jgi:spore coat polysaccharide biosynthesis protein SpsF